MTEGNVRPCDACGASVYSDHIEAGIAGYAAGKMLCPHCLAEATAKPIRRESDGGESVGSIALTDGPIDLGDSSGGSALRLSSGASVTGGPEDKTAEFKRTPLPPTQPAATRCRVFHSKLNDAAMEFMTDHINDWADSHPDVNIKFATSTVGVFEGKHPDPNLIITVFY